MEGERSIGHTLQPVNRPLFELFEGNLCCRGNIIEIQPVGVILLLEDWSCELLLLMIKIGPSLGIDPVKVLSNHLETAVQQSR